MKLLHIIFTFKNDIILAISLVRYFQSVFKVSYCSVQVILVCILQILTTVNHLSLFHREKLAFCQLSGGSHNKEIGNHSPNFG